MGGAKGYRWHKGILVVPRDTGGIMGYWWYQGISVVSRDIDDTRGRCWWYPGPHVLSPGVPGQSTRQDIVMISWFNSFLCVLEFFFDSARCPSNFIFKKTL